MSLIGHLRTILEPSAVLTAQADVEPHVVDWRGRYRGDAQCVVLPSTTDQVSAVVRVVAQAGVPLVPQGGNTSLCEGAVPLAEGPAPVVLNLARMRRIRAVDVADNSMEVEAGCVLASVQQIAVEHGRFYPVSLGAEGSCQIGGNIATNAGGTSVLRYGNTRDNVLGVEVVLPDGRVWNGLRSVRKNSTGPDLKHLFIGSEGTLGVITAATLKLHPLPVAYAVAWMAIRTPQAALEMLMRLRERCGTFLSGFELMNSVQLQIILAHVANRRVPLPATLPWHVLVELSDTGGEERLNKTLQQVMSEGIEAGLVEDVAIATSGAQRAAFWEIRHSVSEGNKKAGMGINTDCAVPISAVPAFIERATAAVHAILPGAPVIIGTHMGDGNVHFIPLASFEQWRSWPDPEAFALRVKHAVNEVAYELGGTFSAEHGIGQVLIREMALFKPAVEIDLMRGIKSMLDPQALFNPGRLLPTASAPPATHITKEPS